MEFRLKAVIRRRAIAAMASALIVAVFGTPPVQAQEYQLFDGLSIAFEGSFALMDTTIRFDSELLGKGTEIHFENDGGLANSKLIPTLSFEWMMGRRHRLSGWWMNVDRDSTKTILEEIQWGDIVFPIEANVRFLLGSEEVALSYTYLFTMKPRHAIGVWGGFRILKTTVGLATAELELSEESDFTAPLPFLGLEYRFGISPKWRLLSDFGIFYIEIGDFSGSQIVLDAWVEYLAFKKVSFGGGIRASRVDAEMTVGTTIAGNFTGATKMSMASVRAFVRLRL